MNESITNSSPFVTGWKCALLILILAAFFRLWGTFELNEYIEDEYLHVTTAMSLGTYGTTSEWAWQHPQLNELIIYGTIQLFGNNTVGWRSSNVFYGTASVALLFLIGRLLYPGTAAPLLAAALLALDPHNIYISRTTFVEIPVTFFFLLYLYLILEYTENKKATLPLAGVAMGLTIATKAYFVFSIPLVVLYALYRVRQRGELTPAVAVDFAVAQLLLPLAVSLLSYFWWFNRGYTLPDFVQMKMDAVWALQHMSSFVNQSFLNAGGKPWEWFTKPLFWGHQRLLNNLEGIFLLQCNNPPFRLLALPSLFISFVYAWKKQLTQELLTPLIFICGYLLIIAPQRPMYSYSSTVLLPFAYLAVARAVTICAIKIKQENVVYACFLSAAVIWCTYLFPLSSARLVSLAPFRPILSLARYMGNF